MSVVRDLKISIQNPIIVSKDVYLYLQMRLVQVNWRHGVRYIVYDVKGKVVIITRDKKVALHYASALEPE